MQRKPRRNLKIHKEKKKLKIKGEYKMYKIKGDEFNSVKDWMQSCCVFGEIFNLQSVTAE
jgi:hypothetical protein